MFGLYWKTKIPLKIWGIHSLPPLYPGLKLIRDLSLSSPSIPIWNDLWFLSHWISGQSHSLLSLHRKMHIKLSSNYKRIRRPKGHHYCRKWRRRRSCTGILCWVDWNLQGRWRTPSPLVSWEPKQWPKSEVYVSWWRALEKWMGR